MVAITVLWWVFIVCFALEKTDYLPHILNLQKSLFIAPEERVNVNKIMRVIFSLLNE